MNDARLDEIKQAADMKAWSEENKKDPQAQKAVELLTKAVKGLEEVEKLIRDAAEQINYTSETYRVSSLANEAEELEMSVRGQVYRIGGQRV